MSGRKPLNSAYAVVEALCLDFERRSKIICDGTATHRTVMELRYLNYKILTAVEEIVGVGRAATMISDIAEGRGYAKTEFPDSSERDYKIKKREVKDNIARALHLVD